MFYRFGESERKGNTLVDMIIFVVIFGSIWGFLEATLGGFLHFVHFPYKGAIMGGIGLSIMTTFVAVGGRATLLVGVGLVAALFKLLDAIILKASIFSQFVVNPATAIMLEAVAFGLIAVPLFRSFRYSVRARVMAGVMAGYLSIILYAIVASIAGMGNWAGIGFQERVYQALVDGTGVAVVGTLLVLAGYVVGSRLRPRFSELRNRQPKLYYVGAAAVVVLCWAIAGVTYAGGF